MVLQAERYPGSYNENSYSSYQGPNGGTYSNYQGVTEQTTPYSGYPQMSTYPSAHAQQQQSGWSTGGDYHGNGASNYNGAGYGSHPVKPSTGGYGNPHYGNSHTHGNSHGLSHGSPHSHGHGSPHSHGHGSPQGYGNSHGYGNSNGYGNSHGYGSGPTNMFNKPSHGHSGYGPSSYGHTPTGTNQPSWILKGLDDDE